MGLSLEFKDNCYLWGLSKRLSYISFIFVFLFIIIIIIGIIIISIWSFLLSFF